MLFYHTPREPLYSVFSRFFAGITSNYTHQIVRTCSFPKPSPSSVQGALHGYPRSVQNVRVNHRHRNVMRPWEFLNRPDVPTRLKEVNSRVMALSNRAAYVTVFLFQHLTVSQENVNREFNNTWNNGIAEEWVNKPNIPSFRGLSPQSCSVISDWCVAFWRPLCTKHSTLNTLQGPRCSVLPVVRVFLAMKRQVHSRKGQASGTSCRYA